MPAVRKDRDRHRPPEPVFAVTAKPYVVGTAIIIGAWSALSVAGGMLNWAAGWSRDTMEAIIGGSGLVLTAAVVDQFKRRGLTFRHCLPAAAAILGGIAVYIVMEYR